MPKKTSGSNYFFNRNPSAYPHQEAYNIDVENIIKETSKALDEAVQEKINMQEYFWLMIKSLGACRKTLALKYNSTDSPGLFGVERNINMSTALYDRYQDYNQRLIHVLSDCLRQARLPSSDLRKFALKVKESYLPWPGSDASLANECVLLSNSPACKTYLKIELWNYTNFNIWSPYNWVTFENYKRLCAIIGKTSENLIPVTVAEPVLTMFHGVEDIGLNVCPRSIAATPLESTELVDRENVAQLLNALTQNQECMELMYQRSPKDYRILKYSQAINVMQNIELHAKKTDWVLMTVYHDLDGRNSTMSEYFTWLCQDNKNDPFDTMTKESIILLLHQDYFLIQDTLSHVAKLFKQAIAWTGTDLRDLQYIVALINYEFSHAMPFMRGSAAISEWIEIIIYRYHGYVLEYIDDNKSVNMEALSLPCQEFINEYPSFIRLSPIPLYNMTSLCITL
jgi:Avirulence protein